MRILHISSEYPPAKIYGLGRFVHGLARAQAAAGDEVIVLTNSSGGAEDDVVIDGVRLHRISFPNPPRPPDGHGEVLQFNHGVLARFLDRIERFRNVDVVASHDWLTAIAAREIARALEKPLVVTFHDEVIGKHFGVLPPDALFVRDLERLTAHDATRVVANSRFIAREIVRHYGVPEDRVIPIPGGIDPAPFRVTADHRVADFRAALASPDDVLVAYLGRLDAEKGLETLAEAALRAASERPALRFVIAGSGRGEEGLRERLAPLRDRARLLGYVQGEVLALLYRAADVIVVPSLYEPFGLVALEGMLAGRAVVVSRAGGLAEIVRDGEDGLAVPPGDPTAFTAALLRLVDDPALRQRLGERAAEHVLAEYSWEAIARRTRSVYEEAIRATRPIRETAPAAPATPLVSVTIAHHNAPVHVETTLRSLFGRTDYPTLEAVVVDNGSAPAALARLEAVVAELAGRGHAISLLRNPENRLFSAAQNQAIRAARGEYVCLLNDDTEVPRGSEQWLWGLVWLLEAMNAGSVTPVTVQRDGRIYCAGGFGGGAHFLREEPDGASLVRTPRRTKWNNMACLLARRHLLLEEPLGELGGLEHYGSDHEWSLRLARERGLSHWVHPARLFHYHNEPTRDPAALYLARRESRIPASVVVVAYDGVAFTREAVEAVLRNTAPPFELVLVDNGSKDGTRAYFEDVRDAFGGLVAVQVIRNEENRGYPAAANQGIQAARGRAVVLLNNDTSVKPGWRDALLAAAASAPEVGVVTAKILNEDGTVQSAGGILHAPDGSFSIPHANALRNAPELSARRAVDNAGGPCMLLTRALIEKVGVFDEAFSPGYFEDSDLCLRARSAGFTLLYEPKAEVFHRGKATANLVAREGGGAIWRCFEENRRRFHERWGAQLAVDAARRAEQAPTAHRRPRVFDCFTFFNELDVLEIRLEELSDVVDEFVLVEATRTFSGAPKPLVFAEHRTRFSRFLGRIRHVVVEDLPKSARSAWEREHLQRDAILRGLAGAEPDDLVMISDVDEIPRASVVASFDGDVAALRQRMSYYRLNCVNVRGHAMDPWSVIVRRRLLRSPQALREQRFRLPCLENAGWHFSYLGDAAAVRRKIEAFSHQELNVPAFTDLEAIERRMAEGHDLFDRPEVEWRFVPIDASFPRCVHEQRARWVRFVREALPVAAEEERMSTVTGAGGRA
jgi:glycogen(starch) synthase